MFSETTHSRFFQVAEELRDTDNSRHTLDGMYNQTHNSTLQTIAILTANSSKIVCTKKMHR